MSSSSSHSAYSSSSNSGLVGSSSNSSFSSGSSGSSFNSGSSGSSFTSASSATVAASSSAPTLPDPPPFVTSVPEGTDGIRVTWTPPANTGSSPIRGYLGQYSLGNGVWLPFAMPNGGFGFPVGGDGGGGGGGGGPRSADVGGLPAGARPQARIATVNDAGPGEWSEPSLPVPVGEFPDFSVDVPGMDPLVPDAPNFNNSPNAGQNSGGQVAGNPNGNTDSSAYFGAGIHAYAIIGNTKFLDIVAVSASFALNTIPTASIVFACGIDTVTGKPAKIHTHKHVLQPRERVQIFAVVKNTVGMKTDALLEDGEYKIFEGYLVGTSYQRSYNQANYVVNVVHWLDDLNSSSALHGDWFPGVPADFAQNAAYRVFGGGAQVSSVSPVPNFLASFANVGKMAEDVWQKLLQEAFLRITGFSSTTQNPLDQDGRNIAAKNALEKMPVGPSGKAAGHPSNYVPLEMRLPGTDSLNLHDALKNYLSRSMGDVFAQHTFWAKLVGEYAGQFMFAVSPAVDWAIPIPFCGGLRATNPDGKVRNKNVKEIKATQYNYANFNANISQILEGVYVFYPFKSATNVHDNTGSGAASAVGYNKPYGAFPEPKPAAGGSRFVDETGLKLFKTPPGWLQDLGGQLSSPFFVQGTDSTADKPRPDKNDQKAPNVDDPKTATKKAGNVIKNWAKHWFYTELMQMRSGELSGPLRFDIAPGSLVKIETPTMDREFGGNLEKDSYVVGTIVSVAYVINSERATAGTSFSLGHIRTPDEEKLDKYTTIDVPLYKQAWYGGPLTLKK